jgi:hypothetical protein
MRRFFDALLTVTGILLLLFVIIIVFIPVLIGDRIARILEPYEKRFLPKRHEARRIRRQSEEYMTWVITDACACVAKRTDDRNIVRFDENQKWLM